MVIELNPTQILTHSKYIQNKSEKGSTEYRERVRENENGLLYRFSSAFIYYIFVYLYSFGHRLENYDNPFYIYTHERHLYIDKSSLI